MKQYIRDRLIVTGDVYIEVVHMCYSMVRTGPLFLEYIFSNGVEIKQHFKPDPGKLNRNDYEKS